MTDLEVYGYFKRLANEDGDAVLVEVFDLLENEGKLNEVIGDEIGPFTGLLVICYRLVEAGLLQATHCVDGADAFRIGGLLHEMALISGD